MADKDIKELVVPGNARTPEQYQKMVETAARGECVLCVGEHNIIREGKYWRFKETDPPYKHHMHHFLIMTREHITDINMLTPEMSQELFEIIQWAIKEYNLPGGGIVMRFGDPDYNAGTVRHLHVHIQVPDLTGLAKATFAKDDEAKVRQEARLKSFQQEKKP